MVKDEDKQLLVDSFKEADQKHSLGAFLDDLLTEQEMADLAQRVKIAKGIIKDQTYLKVSKKVDASTTTITKIGQVIKYGKGAFQKLFGKKEKR